MPKVSLNTFYSYSFGCRLNEAEREEIDRQMVKAGFSFSEAKPDIIIINSCAVTNKAEREVKQMIYQLKKRFLGSKIVITGCAASLWQKLGLNHQIPVDLVINNDNKQYLTNIIQKKFSPKKSVQKTVQIDLPSNKFLRSGRAIIKIQDGCQRFCSYCIVPYLRGKPKSQQIKQIIKKINQLPYIQEVVLTAVNTEAYGYDTQEKLTHLLKAIIRETIVPRISFGSIHPNSIDKNFINLYKNIVKLNRLVNFFHIPIQSGSDKILRLMKRDYSTKEVIWKFNQLKRINRYCLIATDVIVGFVGESDKDFQETYNFLKKEPISKFHIFRFSRRPYTPINYLSKGLGSPKPQIQKIRAETLAELSQKKYLQFLEFLFNKKYQSSALFINKRRNDYQQALMDNQVIVFVKTDTDLAGQLKNVKIELLKDGRLFGKLI